MFKVVQGHHVDTIQQLVTSACYVCACLQLFSR